MSNNKQSSIELFIEQLEEKGGAWENVSIRRVQISIDVSEYMELKQQAKAMHQEEIESTYDDAIMKGRYQEGVEYYKEKFGGNK